MDPYSGQHEELRPFVFDAVVKAWMDGHAAVTTAVLAAVPTGWIRTLDGWEWLDLDAVVDEAIDGLLERRTRPIEPLLPTKMDAAKAMADLHRLVEAVSDGTIYDDYDAGVEMFGKARAAIAVACAYMREGTRDDMHSL